MESTVEHENEIATNKRAAAEAGEHWRALSLREEDRIRYHAARGEYVGPHIARARLYAKTARALSLESQTGLVHCVNCGGGHRPEHCGKFAPCRCKSNDCPWCAHRL